MGYLGITEKLGLCSFILEGGPGGSGCPTRPGYFLHSGSKRRPEAGLRIQGTNIHGTEPRSAHLRGEETA